MATSIITLDKSVLSKIEFIFLKNKYLFKYYLASFL